jgi:hypothetical protein
LPEKLIGVSNFQKLGGSMRRDVIANILILAVALVLPGCATERLRDNTNEVGSTTTDMLYEMVLSNIALDRYFPSGSVLPWDFQVNNGTIAVNDTLQATGGVSAGAHTILMPSISLPETRALQQNWNVSPTNDVKLLDSLKTIYAFENCYFKKNYKDTKNDGPLPPSGDLKGTYRGLDVWVERTDDNAMKHLTNLVMLVNFQAEKPTPGRFDPTTKKWLPEVPDPKIAEYLGAYLSDLGDKSRAVPQHDQDGLSDAVAAAAEERGKSKASKPVNINGGGGIQALIATPPNN